MTEENVHKQNSNLNISCLFIMCFSNKGFISSEVQKKGKIAESNDSEKRHRNIKFQIKIFT